MARGNRARPSSRSTIVQQLFEIVQASGKAYPKLDEEMGWSHSSTSRVFLEKHSKTIRLEKMAERLGYEIKLVKKETKGNETAGCETER